MTGWGRVREEEQAVEIDDLHEDQAYVREGVTAHVGERRVSYGMAEIKLLCFKWPSPLLKLV